MYKKQCTSERAHINGRGNNGIFQSVFKILEEVIKNESLFYLIMFKLFGISGDFT